MFHKLPKEHNLPSRLIKPPLFHFDDYGEATLTKTQVLGINAGVGIGNSLLVIAPTSSGKTEVGLLAAATWLVNGDGLTEKVVYLVTHRALARQKFAELSNVSFLELLNLEESEIVLSTGDSVVDGQGIARDDPLEARFLIATYEKYLALLASSGHRRDMKHICAIADEVQILGDPYRGQSIEVLLTILKTAGFGQFIGLSAVLSTTDTKAISDWLDVEIIKEEEREVPLTYELRSPKSTYFWSTDGVDDVQESNESRPQTVVEILEELASNEEDNFPVAVFCMTKRRILELSTTWAQTHSSVPVQTELAFEEPTGSSAILASCIPNGFGIHTADLIDTERSLVEDRLQQNKLPVVFATTTLAQGLNFHFKTVIFDNWMRWDFDSRIRRPITYNEFHNIAGRAGRLGMQERGHILFSASSTAETTAAARFLQPIQPDLELGQIKIEEFDSIALQLISAGLAHKKEDLFSFLANSLTGALTRDNTHDADRVWTKTLDATIVRLQNWGMIK